MRLFITGVSHFSANPLSAQWGKVISTHCTSIGSNEWDGRKSPDLLFVESWHFLHALSDTRRAPSTCWLKMRASGSQGQSNGKSCWNSCCMAGHLKLSAEEQHMSNTFWTNLLLIDSQLFPLLHKQLRRTLPLVTNTGWPMLQNVGDTWMRFT